MTEDGSRHVHFMGICGSGCASVAMLAAKDGWYVSGCDQSTDSYYAKELKKLDIKIHEGHDTAHLSDDVDYVAVSPAIFDISPDNPELKEAAERGILMTWQEFMGRHLQQGKRVIAICGTHGKTTTTFLAGEILIDAGLDPSVLGGSVYKKWGNGGRSGSSGLFLCEADEFNRNFLNYHPEILVVNNAEMDHPECYRDYEDMIGAYCSFVKDSENLKTLILNGDSEGAMDILERTKETDTVRNAEKIIFTRNADFSVKTANTRAVVYGSTVKNENGTDFVFTDMDGKHAFHMNLYGEYNVSNAVTAAIVSRVLGVSDEDIQKSLLTFSGVGRRFDRVGSFRNVPVFDDYAHHPTEISSVLSMCSEYFDGKKICAVFEPHQVSRLRLMFDRYAEALTIADHVIVTRTHLGREIHKNVRPITEEEWRAASDRILYAEEFEEIRELLSGLQSQGECDIIVVIGAANSYRISRFLCGEG